MDEVFSAQDYPSYGVIPVTYHSYAKPVPIEAPGTGLTSLPRALLMIVQRGYNKHGLQRPKAGVSYEVAGEDEKERWFDILREAKALYSKFLNSDEPLAEITCSHLKKFGPLGTNSPGAFVRDDIGSPISATPFSEQGIAALEELLTDRMWNGSYPEQSMRLGTNHSDPTWRNTMDDLLLHIAMSRDMTTPSKAQAALKFIRQVQEGMLPETWVLTQYTRRQTGAKRLRLTRMADRLEAYGEMEGTTCRTRPVFGAPTCLNEVERLPVMELTRRMKRWYTFNHDSETSTLNKMRSLVASVTRRWGSAVIHADDISGFDMSICKEHQMQIYNVYEKILPRANWLAKYRMDTPIVGASLQADQTAYLYSRNGRNASGDIKTTLDNCLINFMLVLHIVARVFGVTVTSAWNMYKVGDWGTLIMGDDTILIVPEFFDMEKYAAIALEYNSHRGIEPACVFLGTVYDLKRGVYYNGADRCWINSFARERRAPGPWTELFGAAKRWIGAVKDPRFNTFWRSYVDKSKLLSLIGVKDVYAFHDWSLTSRALELISAEIQDDPHGDVDWFRMLDEFEWRSASLGSAYIDTLRERVGGARSYASQYKEFLAKYQDLDIDWKKQLVKIYANA